MPNGAGAAAAGLAMEIIKALTPKVIDLVARAMAGDDITHDQLIAGLPKELKSKVRTAAKRAARLAAGLPT